MNNEHDTKEITTVHEQPTPDTPQEGATVADTPENLTIRVTALEIWKQTYETATNARFDNLLTPDQIKALIQASNQEVHDKINTLTASNERMVKTNEQRTETVNGWMEAQRVAWQALFGRDITDKDSKQLTPSIFDRMASVEKKADDTHSRADAATLEVSEMRADFISAQSRADTAKADSDNAKAEYEKFKPLFETLQTTVNQLLLVQEAERLKRERSRQLRDTAFKVAGELIKRPEFWALFGAGGASAGAFVLKLLGAF